MPGMEVGGTAVQGMKVWGGCSARYEGWGAAVPGMKVGRGCSARYEGWEGLQCQV